MLSAFRSWCHFEANLILSGGAHLTGVYTRVRGFFVVIFEEWEVVVCFCFYFEMGSCCFAQATL